MKLSMIEAPFIEEIDPLKENTIQGLYPVKNSSQSYWTLKAICELSKFREHKKKGKTTK